MIVLRLCVPHRKVTHDNDISVLELLYDLSLRFDPEPDVT